MSAEVTLVPLQRKTIVANSRAGTNGPTAPAQIDDALWTGGKEFRQDVPSEHEDPHWYRVGISALNPLEDVKLYYRIVPHDKLNDESYQRYSQFDLLHDDDMVEVAPSETLRFWVVVGSESNKDPSEERSFVVFAQEFAVPVQHALLREVSRTALRWIRRPVLQQVALNVRNRRVWQAPEILASLFPWRRSKPCVIELDNLSPFPVTAAIHVDAEARPGKAAAVGVRSVMRDPLPSGQRHREECRIPVLEPVGGPVVMRVTADVKLATDRIAQPISAPNPIEVRRIPWLRCWEPYATAFAAALVAAVLLFGASPWIEPDATVTLVLQKLPKSAEQRDLNVTLRLIGSDPPLDPVQGIAIKRDGDRLTYRFKWRPTLRGFRWDWAKQYDMELAPRPRPGAESEFAHYRMEPTPVQGSFSGGSAIVLNSAEVPITYLNRTASIVIPSTDPPVPFTYEVLDDNGKLVSDGQSARESRAVPIEILESERNVHINIRSQNELRQSMDVTLQPGDRHVVAWTVMPESPLSTPVQPAAGAGGSPAPNSASSSAVIPRPSPPQSASGSAGAPTPTSRPNAGDSAAKPTAASVHRTATTSSPPAPAPPDRGAPTPGKPVPAPRDRPGLQLDKVEAWCGQLGDAPAAAGLAAGSKEPDALHFTGLKIAKKEVGSYTLIVNPSKECYIQVYELAPPGEPQPVFGIDPDTRQSLPMSYPGAIARPRLARANTALSIDRPAHGPSGAVIVLALRSDTEPADDLAALLRQASSVPSLKDWTIGYAAYSSK